MLVQERKKVFKLQKVVLLDDLGINVRRSQCFDLGDQKVPDSLDGLISSASTCFSSHRRLRK